MENCNQTNPNNKICKLKTHNNTMLPSAFMIMKEYKIIKEIKTNKFNYVILILGKEFDISNFYLSTLICSKLN